MRPAPSANPTDHTDGGFVAARLDRRVAFGLMFVLIGSATLVSFGHSFDDPLITLRYAHHVVTGHGPVFVPGWRVEGFTSPLHLVVAMPATAVSGGTDLLVLKGASVLFAFLAGYRAVVLLRRIGLPGWAEASAIMLIGGSWILGIAASDALETTLSIWLMVWLLDLAVSGDAADRPLRTAVVAGLAVSVRPDNLLGVGLIALVAIVVDRRAEWSRRVRWLAGPVVAMVVLTGARLVYYGELFPNTFYAKSVARGPAARRGAQHLAETFARQFRIDSWHAPVVIAAGGAVGAAVLVAILGRRDAAWRSTVAYLAAAAVATVGFVVYSGGGSGGGPRFVAPLVVPTALLVAMGATEVVRRLPRRWSPVLAGGAVAIALVVTALPFTGPLRTVSVLTGGTSNSHLIAEGGSAFASVWAAQPRLATCAPEGATVAATEIGLLGDRRLDLEIIDMRGLTNDRIAHAAPIDIRSPVGVTDPQWYEPTSTVGAELDRTDPVLILTFDDVPAGAEVLEGRYRSVHEQPVDRFTFRAWARIGGPCDRPFARSD